MADQSISANKKEGVIYDKQTNNSKKSNRKVTSRRAINVKITFLKAMPHVIAYARTVAIKRVSRHQYQNLLFPQSQGQYKLQSLTSDQSYSSIAKSFYNDYQQAKYPFYLTKCGFFIEDAYLNILKVDRPIASDFLGIEFGKIVCFGEYAGNQQFYAKNKLNFSQNKHQNKHQDKQYTKNFWQQYLVVATEEDYILVIHNSKKNLKYIKLQLKKKKKAFKTKIQTIKIISKYLFVFTQYEFFIIEYDSSLQKNSLKIYTSNYLSKENHVGMRFFNLVIMPRQSEPGKSDPNQPGRFLIFASKTINYDLIASETQSPSTQKIYQLVLLQINQGIFSGIKSEKIILQLKQQILNCKVKYYSRYLPNSKQNCFITYTTKKNINICYYDIKKEAIKLSNVYANPKAPPEISKLLFLSRIQYIDPVQQYQKDCVQNEQSLREQLSSSEYSGFSPRGSFSNEKQAKKQPDQHIFVLVSYPDRLYPFKLSLQKQEITPAKRIKFKNKRILEILSLSKGAFCLVSYIHDKIDFFNFQGSALKQQRKKLFQRPDVRILEVMVTLISKVLDYNQFIINERIQKFATYLVLPQNNQPKTGTFHVFSNQFGNRQLLILPQNLCVDHIFRVQIKSWNSLYFQILKTQNIKLLKFLILSKNCPSPFLQIPNQQIFSSYKLQSFFSPSDNIQKMLLLEYYSAIGIPPNKEKLNIKNQPNLLIPFIINHSVTNIQQETLQFMVQFWVRRDERLVQQLIVGGAESGWQLAVKRGWIRALRKMVQMGTQIDLPVLKLYSFILTEEEKNNSEELISPTKVLKEQKSVLKKIKKQQQQDDNAELRWLPLQSSKFSMSASEAQGKAKISYYCMQIIQYSKLAFDTFLRPPFHCKKEQLNLFYKALLTGHLFDLLIYYQPRKCLSLVSYIFLPRQKIQYIDQFDIRKFLQCNRQYDQLQITNGNSISQMIFSHVSASFLLNSRKKQQAIQKERKQIGTKNSCQSDSQHQDPISSESQHQEESISPEQVKEKLMIEHARLFQQGIFQFKTRYKKQMMLLMVKDSNKALLQLMKMKAKSGNNEQISSEQDLQYRMQEFLENLWLSIADQLSQKEVKELMGSLEMLNSRNHYLSIAMMRRLPAKDYSAKMLRKYLQSPNKYIRRKVFGWIHQVLPHVPEFQKQIITNLKQLIEIDKQLSRHLFSTYFASRQIEIISRIDSDPLLQLQYIQLIIKDHIENQVELDEYYTNLHMSLLLNLEPERVIPVLEDTNSVGPTGGNQSRIRYNMAELLKTSQQIEIDIQDSASSSASKSKMNVNMRMMSKQINSQSYREQITRILSYLYEKMGQIEKSIQKKLQLLESYFRSLIITDQKQNTNFEDDEQTQTRRDRRKKSSIDISNEQQQLVAVYSDSQQQNNSDNIQDQLRKRKSTLMVFMSQDKDKSKQVQYHLKSRFQEQFREILLLIFRQSIVPYSYFYVLLSFLYQLMNGIKHSRYKNKIQYIKLIRKEMGLAIVEMFQRGYSAFFVQWINGEKLQQDHSTLILEQFIQKIKKQFGPSRSKQKSAQSILNQMKKYLLFGYDKLNSQIQLLQNWTAIDINVLIEDVQITQQKLSMGIYSAKRFCLICGKPFKEQGNRNQENQSQQALLFNCGHAFHVRCIQQQDGKDFCWECAQKDKFRTMIQHEDIELVQVLRKYQSKKKNSNHSNVDNQIQLAKKGSQRVDEKGQPARQRNELRKRTNRLSLFDKRVNTISTQAEIIDMRITIEEYYSQQTKQ